MTTGLEALGAASAVLSVISFAGSLISLTYKIYDGQPPPQAELEGYVQQLLYAANRVQLRSERVPQVTQTEKKLCEVAKECMRVTKALQQEISTITNQNRKGKFPRAIHMAFQAYKHRSKIKDLETSLRFCRETLETELLLNICDTSATMEQQQSEGFRGLKGNIQNFISQAVGGNTIIDGLITREAKVILDNISTQITVELEALYARTMSDNRCNRFLSSIKFVEMKKRCNEVTPSSDAFFDRVFIAYKRIHSESFDHKSRLNIGKISHADFDLGTSKSIVDEIDQQWYSFSSWLQSDDKLFWIRGKPASGKSTLINFIINNDATKRLLDSRSRNPDTRILSHFFWKIGSERQNSIKGLLSTLLYEILCEDRDMVPQVLERFDLSQHDSYDDWSAQDLEKVLFTVLQTQSRLTCIFIDGLDEISDKDGFLKLMDIVQKLGSCRNLKVCVSSRPEIELENRLQKIGAKSLYLEKLTRPEMALYVHGQLGRYAENQIPTSRLKRFIATLLDKAEGVFLWLILATKSLANGIENGDNEKTLSDRLQELPGELEALYEAMWARLNANNPVYRETAARYFRCITADGGHEGFSTKDSGMDRWIWIVDEKTIITASTEAEDGNENSKASLLQTVLDSIIYGEKRGTFEHPTSVHSMMDLILGVATDFFARKFVPLPDSPGRVFKTPLEVFRESLRHAADEEIFLYQTFLRELNGQQRQDLRQDESISKHLIHDMPSHPLSSSSDPYSISPEAKVLDTIRDIREELHMLKSLVEDQELVWRQAFKDRAAEEFFQYYQPCTPEDVRKDLDDMLNEVETINNSINTLLYLRQKQASISQANDTAKQSNTIFVFTVITIVFLPLSFLSSLFALDVSSFPHESGSLKYPGWWLFPILFGASAIISFPTILLAWKVNDISKRFRASNRRDLRKHHSSYDDDEEFEGRTVQGLGYLARRAMKSRRNGSRKTWDTTEPA